MATYSYTFVNAGSFPNRKVDIPRFTQEIQNAVGILVALDSITLDEQNCNIVFRADLPIEQILALEQVIFAHTGESLDPPARAAVVIQPFSDAGRQIFIDGHRLACDQLATSFDVSWATDIELQGIIVRHNAGLDGDYVTAAIHHPLDMVNPVLSFGKSYVKPGDPLIISMEAESAKKIPAGIKLKLTYHAVAAGGAAVLYTDIVLWK
jgi:hypothetical protein